MIETKTAYDPAHVEAKWTKYWFDEAVFDLDINADKPSFSCALPPPNITGQLHMGHALNGTLQDVLIRWKRMQGYNVLWQPGTDHAGIATQMVVERELKKTGVTRHQLGREKFLERVWQWRKDYGDKILNQYQRLGVSFNWDRIAFTMDEGYTQAIMRAFVTLFNEGFIYRGQRVTNWCPRCSTSLSDLEVEHVETKGHLYNIKYLLAEGNGEIIVATTRPETMFGDVAVAVNPRDERYKSFIGKTVILPIAARAIPIIADDYVDMEFGTGALKITPAHDANDWEVGQRHKLAEPITIDADGKLSKNEFVPEHLQGTDRFVARKQIVEELELTGLLAGTQDYVHGVAHCERCHTVLEPRLSPQWYVRMKDLAAPAIKVVEDDRITFIPERYTASYLDWMRNVRDWCVSRQLWWGHRIPIWTCKSCANVAAFETAPAKCAKCEGTELEQDPDVLDTWFSSALWPFATLGWPEESIEQKTFYPTTILSTAREIIPLWVARMIFMSLKLKGTIPFKHVLIHPVIQTPDGKRMSKSKGNAVDPLDMIDKYGADANRFWFASLGVKGDQDVRFREDRLDEYKRFANKLWNAGRLVLTSLEGFKPTSIDKDRLTLADRWILNRYNRLLQTMQDGLRDYDFSEVSRAIYEFTWDYFCDWYLEIAKIQLAEPDRAEQTKQVLYTVFEGLLRALHPIMPFITEELWSRINKSEFLSDYDTIMFAPYPRPDERFFDDAAENDMGLIIKVIRAIRNIRQTYNVPPSLEAEVIIHCADKDEANCLRSGQNFIARLGRAKPVTIEATGAVPAKAAYELMSKAKIYLPLANLIDLEKTKVKLLQRKQAIEKDLAKVEGTLANPDFVARAPQDKIDTIKSELNNFQQQMASVVAQLAVLEEA